MSTSPAPAAAGHHPEPGEVRRPWTVLALLLAAQFMVVLDVSVVNVALPSIGADLHLSSSSYQWTVSAYVLMSGGLLLLGGRIADLLDRRTVFVTGLAVFTLGSLASGLAGSATALVLSRAGQGMGAALLTPAALSIVLTTYAGRQRAAALAVWGTVGSMGIAAGVLFGGLLTSALDWRAVFFINFPIGLNVLVGVLRLVPRGESRGLRGLDLPGAVALVVGLLALVRTIEAAGRDGWTTTTVLTGAAAAVLLTGFALLEHRTRDPLVPPRIWRVRSLVSASTVMAGVTGAVVGAIFLSSIYLQQVLGASPVVAGLQLLPLAAAISLSAAVASHLLPHAGPRLLIAVGLVVCAGAALLLSTAGADATYVADVLPGFLLLGAGVGPMFVAISVGAMADVPDHAAGLASGLMMTGHEVGAALGVALLTTVAGDLTTRAGLVAGYGDAFVAVAALCLALLVPTSLVPRTAAAGAGGHGHHGH
ncbi:MFS transporter [uncultured Nocardioides sp.]|uniref:MFS transporter n=1 Tax=uncultured Nocardioides sp. TaxID=198441 RepID=UPI00260D7344|nr:MFS transporter [uncultured Nocardioides sp.]